MNTTKKMVESGALAIVRADVERACEIADGLIKGGVPVMEMSYTFNTAGDDIKALKEKYGEAAKGLPIKIGIAPEREGSTDFVKEAVEHGFTIALGHSNATYADAVAAVQAGATMWVHAFRLLVFFCIFKAHRSQWSQCSI